MNRFYKHVERLTPAHNDLINKLCNLFFFLFLFYTIEDILIYKRNKKKIIKYTLKMSKTWTKFRQYVIYSAHKNELYLINHWIYSFKQFFGESLSSRFIDKNKTIFHQIFRIFFYVFKYACMVDIYDNRLSLIHKKWNGRTNRICHIEWYIKMIETTFHAIWHLKKKDHFPERYKNGIVCWK